MRKTNTLYGTFHKGILDPLNIGILWMAYKIIHIKLSDPLHNQLVRQNHHLNKLNYLLLFKFLTILSALRKIAHLWDLLNLVGFIAHLPFGRSIKIRSDRDRRPPENHRRGHPLDPCWRDTTWRGRQWQHNVESLSQPLNEVGVYIFHLASWFWPNVGKYRYTYIDRVWGMHQTGRPVCILKYFPADSSRHLWRNTSLFCSSTQYL